MTPWDELVALAEHELALARDSRWEELPAAQAARNAAASALGQAPPAARPALERLVALHRELTALLTAARADTLAELTRMRHGRSAVRGYAGAAPAPARSLGRG